MILGESQLSERVAMNKCSEKTEVPIWLLVVKGWFFGMLSLSLPLLVVIGVSMLLGRGDIEIRDVILSLFFLPVILIFQGLLLGVIISFGLRVAIYLGFHSTE